MNNKTSQGWKSLVSFWIKYILILLKDNILISISCLISMWCYSCRVDSKAIYGYYQCWICPGVALYHMIKTVRDSEIYSQWDHKRPQLRTWSACGLNCWNGPQLGRISHKRPNFLFCNLNYTIEGNKQIAAQGNSRQFYHNEHTHFCRIMCYVVNTRFLKTFWNFDENNDS